MADLTPAQIERIVDHAKMIWIVRENAMWGKGKHFAKQTWEQGTDLAKRATVAKAMRELGYA